MDISDEEFRELKNKIKAYMRALEIEQRKYRALTGRNYKPFFLTDDRNRATLETTRGGDNPDLAKTN